MLRRFVLLSLDHPNRILFYLKKILLYLQIGCIAEYQRTVEESNGNYQVKQYKIVTCVTTFSTVRVKMKATNPRFEQVLAGLEDVIAYNNANK